MANRTLPRKTEGLLEQHLDGELLVIDTRQRAHVLTGDLTAVWKALEGAPLELAPADTQAAIAQLSELGLVEVTGGYDRRALLVRAGAVTVAGAAITVGLPAMANAASSPQSKFGPVVTLESLTATPASPKYAAAFTLTASVIGVTGSALPAGTVELFLAGKSLGTKTLSGGKAVFSVTAPKAPAKVLGIVQTPTVSVYTATFTSFDPSAFLNSSASALTVNFS